MSGGERLEEVHKIAAPACGAICTMIVKRQISRTTLEWCARELRRAADNIDLLLTGGGRPG